MRLRGLALPIFVDIEPEYFCVDPYKVEQAITSNTKAIMIVNMYGNTCDVDAFMRIRNKYSLPIVEDCSENLGGHYQGNMWALSLMCLLFHYMQTRRLPQERAVSLHF